MSETNTDYTIPGVYTVTVEGHQYIVVVTVNEVEAPAGIRMVRRVNQATQAVTYVRQVRTESEKTYGVNSDNQAAVQTVANSIIAASTPAGTAKTGTDIVSRRDGPRWHADVTVEYATTWVDE